MFVLIFSSLIVSVLSSALGDQKSIAVTIYNDDFAMVKDVREFHLDKGHSFIYFTDVAQNIEPQTVTFKPLGNLGLIRVYEQNFQKNLIDKEKILKKYIDKQVQLFVTLGTNSRRVSGKLLGYDNGYILQTNFGISIFNKIDSIEFPSLPDGFFSTPTLNWKVLSQNRESVDCQVAYRTTGFSWKADYTLILKKQQASADIGGWVTIDNFSGKKYVNAKLKLIAGEVNSVGGGGSIRFKKMLKQAQEMSQSADLSFKEKSFSDFHMYTLSQPVTLNESSQKQVEFIPKVINVSVRKYNLLQINAGGYGRTHLKATNRIQFANNKSNRLGLPFPKGVFRVFQEDTEDGSLEFIGQDNIEHTPKDQKITLQTGKSFDITADLYVQSRTEYRKEQYKADMNLTIRNHKQIDAQIEVMLWIYFSDLTIVWNTQAVELVKLSQRTYKFSKVLKPDQTFVAKWRQDYFY